MVELGTELRFIDGLGEPHMARAVDDRKGDALIGIYDGVVDTTSHVIETVAKAIKQF